MPFAYWLGRIAEEFNCTPSQAYAEWQRWPVGFLEEIIESRRYAQAMRAVELNRTDPPDLPLVGLAQVIELELEEADQNAEASREDG